MAISDRINEMYTHVGDVYDTITNVDLPTNKNIQNIPSTMRSSYLEIMNNGIDTIWNNWEKVEGTGETLTLNSTEEAPMKINLKGNTSQETTTGKNKYNATRSSATTNSVTYSGDTSKIYINGTPNNAGRIFFNKTYLEAGTYTFSATLTKGSFTNGGNNVTYLYLYKGTETTASWDFVTRILLTAIIGNVVSATFTISEGSYYYLAWYLDTSYTWTNAEIKYQVESGSSFTSFEPYTGGQASPNPQYPQNIHVVSGDNSIDVCGKNLLSNDITGSISWRDTSVTYNGSAIKVSKSGTDGISANAHTNIRYFPLTTGKTYTFSMNYKSGKIITEGVSYGWGFYIYGVNKDGSTSNSTGYRWTCDLPKTTMPSNHITFTPDKDFIGFKLGCYIPGASLKTDGDVYFDCQVEVGEATTYEPYQSASYPINLGDIELCKIGEYQDSIVKDNGKWYLNKQIGKVVLNGSEDWGKSSSTANTLFYFSNTIPYKNGTTSSSTDLYCNYFEGKIVWGNNVIGCELYVNNSIRFGLTTSSTITTLEQWKTWLSTHNTTVYYVLATPTYTEITDTTLQQQLNALEKARSYNSQTNLTQTNDDISFIITATALESITNS